MSTQQTHLRDQFIDLFDGEPIDDGEWDVPDDVETNQVLRCGDNLVMYCPTDVPSVGAVNFTDYTDSDEWSMGYTDVEDRPTSVYAFETTTRSPVAVQAAVLEKVAELFDVTPATLADQARTYRQYPVVFERDGVRIAVSPVLGEVSDEK